MAAKTQKQTNSSQGRTNDDIELRVASLEIRFQDIVIPMLNRIELSQGAMKTAMDTMRFVPIKDFTDYQKEAEKKYASAATVRWLLGIVGGIIIGASITILGVALR